MAEKKKEYILINPQVCLLANLSWTEKVLLSIIVSYKTEFFATNAYLAKRLMLSSDSICRLISGLVRKGYIERNIIYKENSKHITKRVLKVTRDYSYICLDTIGDNADIPIGINSEDINKTFKKKTNNKDKNKERKKEPTTYDKIVSDYTSNEKLQKTIFDFIKMRKAINKFMTDAALKCLFEKLDKFTTSDSDKIEILKHSILNSYPDIYTLKNNSKKPKETEKVGNYL